MIKCLVVGCGSIGERHIRNLKKLYAGEILVCDLDKKRLDLIKKQYRVSIFSNLKDAFVEKPNIVFICTPPSSHISVAKESIENGAHVFIEKPISHNLEKIDELILSAKKNNLHIFVGYNFRFQKGMKLIKKMLEKGIIGKIIFARAEFGQYLPDWRPWQDYKKSYTAKKSLGGGIILDGSHEIDYLRWLMGDVDSISCFADKVSNLDVETEDIAEILIKFKNGSIGQIHLDFIRHGYARNCEIIGDRGVIIWDFAEKVVKVLESKKDKWEVIKISDDVNDMYIKEIKHVIKTIENDTKPLIDGYEGKKTLELALAAKKSSQTNKVVML